MSFVQDIKNEISGQTQASVFRASNNWSQFVDDLNEEQLHDFVAGVFLATAQSSIQITNDSQMSSTGINNNGYHIEFILDDLKNAQVLCEILAIFDILPKLTFRKHSTVVYIKSSEDICNLLAVIGASKSLLKLNNEIAVRDVRNKTNRRTNCDTYNIEKQIAAAAEQVEIIKSLEANGKLNVLDKKLQIAARARLEHPDATYDELAQILSLTKSGVVHRLKKIINEF